MCILLVTKALTSLTPSVNYSDRGEEREESGRWRKEGRGGIPFGH